MLGTATDESVAASEVNDVVGELCTLVAGGLKSTLCDIDRPCAVSTPSIIRGAFEVEAPTTLVAEKFFFLCLDQRLAVEVHLKFE